jgi:trehalose/maltose hydrolase-like predicted phosphorylase
LGYVDVAWDYFRKSVFLDLYNIMENTQDEGIHLAALGASWQALVFGLAGLRQGEDGRPTVHPKLPRSIRGLRFSVVMGGCKYEVSIEQGGNKNSVC